MPDRSELLELVLDYYAIPIPVGMGNRKVHCPVHDDRHASASMDVGKGVFRCFACGAGGSGIDIVMGREGLDYSGAVAFIRQHIDSEGAALRRGVSGKPGRGVHGESGNSGKRRRYVPSWLRTT